MTPENSPAPTDSSTGNLPQNTPINLQGIEYLVFVTLGKKLAVPITDVREIRGWSPPTPLPHAPEFLVGVVNLRGTVLPVIDLARRLGLGPTPHAERNVFIVIEVDERAIGLLVEAVADIHTSAGEDHQPVPQGGQSQAESCINSLLLAEDEMIQILEPSAVWTAAHSEQVVAA